MGRVTRASRRSGAGARDRRDRGGAPGPAGSSAERGEEKGGRQRARDTRACRPACRRPRRRRNRRCPSPRARNGRFRATSLTPPARGCWRVGRACGRTSSMTTTARWAVRSGSPTTPKCPRSRWCTAASPTRKVRPTKTARTSSPPASATRPKRPTGGWTGTRWQTPTSRSPSGRSAHGLGGTGERRRMAGQRRSVSSAGIQYALVVSAQHAQLLEVATGKPVSGAELHTEVNMAARSFIVRIPTSVLPVSGSWQVRLAAGLANAAGTEFATVPPQDGGIPGATNVYNVTFRSYQQESPLVCPTEALPDSAALELGAGRRTGGAKANATTCRSLECGNFWMESDQANTLASGDVSKYALAVDWSQLAAGESDTRTRAHRLLQPLVRHAAGARRRRRGSRRREHIHRAHLPRPRAALRGVRAHHLQPQAKPAPLTWILHSLGVNLQPVRRPRADAARRRVPGPRQHLRHHRGLQRRAVVLRPRPGGLLGRLAPARQRLRPRIPTRRSCPATRWAASPPTSSSLEYPDLFAQAMPLEGPVVCGERFVAGVETAAGSGGQCESDGKTTPLIVNAKWIPYVMTYGAPDELVPFTGGLEQVEAFNKLGYRYYAVLVPGRGSPRVRLPERLCPRHVPARAPRTRAGPGIVHLQLVPRPGVQLARHRPHGDYWISGLQARSTAPASWRASTPPRPRSRNRTRDARTPRGHGLRPHPGRHRLAHLDTRRGSRKAPGATS